jgi:hydroxyacylglutathione hydrolase
VLDVSQPIVVSIVDEELGNNAYLVDLGEGRGLVVDASRDLRSVHAAVGRRGLTVAYAADTHLHADFLSGARQLAATDGATVLASAAGHRAFPHTGLTDGDELDLGGLRLRALTTPGHTDEHLAFLLLDGETPQGVFTGGSLLVGSAARTDLVDPNRTEELARAQYRSLQRLLAIPDDTPVWPTHGAGSFCSAPPGADRTSSIGREKADNPLLQAKGEDAFVALLLGSLGSFPAYFRRLGELNRRGPALLDAAPAIPPVGPVQAWPLLRDGAQLIDVRPFADFAARHIAGSVSIPLRDVFATWLGWVAPHDRPLLLVRNNDQDRDEIAWQAAKIGYTFAGELTSGPHGWTAAGLPTATTRLVTVEDLQDQPVLDVRQRTEFTAGHLPGAGHAELGALADSATVPVLAGPTVLMCGHGERAMTGASLLERHGREVSVLVGGPEEWARAHRTALETGDALETGPVLETGG